MFKRKNSDSSNSADNGAVKTEDNDHHVLPPEKYAGEHLHRGLKSRHITMIAIGGTIGTGLIIGTGSALSRAGPGAVLVSYIIVSSVVFLVMAALGEMASWMPIESGFTGYASRFVNPALGFSLGYTMNQLLRYSVLRLFEFWLPSIKVTVIVALIILSLVLALGGGLDYDRKGFRYWKKPGAFKTYLIGGDAGRFLGVWFTFVTATFAYLGTELVGVTVGEVQNPRKTIPRAIKLAFYRILFFYVLSVLLLGTVIPYDSPALLQANKRTSAGQPSASASPFVAALVVSGIEVLPGFLNACILLFVFSASNSNLYIASRTIYGLAVDGKAPRILAHTDIRGVPVYALGLSASFALAFMNIRSESSVVFGYFANLVTIFGILTWTSILTSHIWFVRACKGQGITNDQLAYTAPLGIWGSYGALFMCCLIAVSKNFNVFVYSASPPKGYGKFDNKNFITSYLGILLYLIMIFGHKFIRKTKGVKPYTADLFEGKQRIGDGENDFLAWQAQHKGKALGGWFYRHFVEWLF